MSSTAPTRLPFVDTVFHPTDLGASSDLAFAHALAIVLLRRGRLDILHAGSTPNQDWHRFPAVRATLERWGVLEPGSDRSAVLDELCVRVRKIDSKGDPVTVSLDYVRENQPDLVVLGTESRTGLSRFKEPSRAASVARRSQTMSLIVPDGCRGFVEPDTGSLSLRRILVPVDASPNPSDAILRATRAAERLGDPPVEIELLHVGESPLPAPGLPEGEGWRFQETTRAGDVVEEILRAGERASLIIMPTDGRDGVLDVLRGSVTERVVRRADCPVLAVPSV